MVMVITPKRGDGFAAILGGSRKGGAREAGQNMKSRRACIRDRMAGKMCEPRGRKLAGGEYVGIH